MYKEDEAKTGAEKSCEFGVLGEVLRTLQIEELKQTETYQLEVSETCPTENIRELISEINETLKELAETQKKILEEIKKNSSQN
jgi:CRISPR/Cas system CMR-associated protein Cmr1 (group 7 of RAMP superfamily)